MSRCVDIHLGGDTPYSDYPQIPERFARDYKLWVTDPDEGGGMQLVDRVQSDGEPDIVSEAIITYGVWEVPETILLASAFAAAPRHTLFVDIGAHIGWFSALAGSFGLDVTAIDSNYAALVHLSKTWRENEFHSQLLLTPMEVRDGIHFEVNGRTDVIVKIDVEGAEVHAVHALWPWFETATVTHCLMEVSPCFNDSYPELLGELFGIGYRGYMMPRKREEPRPVGPNVFIYLMQECRRLDVMQRPLLAEWLSHQHQFDLILFRPDAPWG